MPGALRSSQSIASRSSSGICCYSSSSTTSFPSHPFSHRHHPACGGTRGSKWHIRNLRYGCSLAPRSRSWFTIMFRNDACCLRRRAQEFHLKCSTEDQPTSDRVVGMGNLISMTAYSTRRALCSAGGCLGHDMIVLAQVDQGRHGKYGTGRCDHT